MPNTILIGAQWGDEGKGKIIDVLTENADIVVRMQGGNNAGHTVLVGKQEYILHLVPSGILRRGKRCLIGNGVVVDPVQLVREIDGLKELGVRVDRNLSISETCHLVLPYHRLLDEYREIQKGKNKIGTTKRGIGPAYGDKAARVGLRMIDLVNPPRFTVLLKDRMRVNNGFLKSLGAKPLSFQKVLEECLIAGDRLRPYVTNTVLTLHQAIKRGKKILFEGAQGSYLDIDHGTYPFVTSSSTTSGGACTGTGVPPNRIDRVVGVMKAYTTRVGEGPFPTENSEVGEMLHAMGREFGATTGRPRRCGWFDSVLTRYSTLVNGTDEIAVTNVDGLDSLESVNVCVGYRDGKKRYDYVPSDSEVLGRCEPIYKKFSGWKRSTEDCRRWRDLPLNARRYLEAIAELSNAKLAIVSVGPARSQTIVV